MSDVAVKEMRERMLKETEGFLSHKLFFDPAKQRPADRAFVEYYRRYVIRHGQIPDQRYVRQVPV